MHLAAASEYCGCSGSDLDFSPNALQGWREWLAVKYRANITQLNSDWGTVFWGADYANFTEVIALVCWMLV